MKSVPGEISILLSSVGCKIATVQSDIIEIKVHVEGMRKEQPAVYWVLLVSIKQMFNARSCYKESHLSTSLALDAKRACCGLLNCLYTCTGTDLTFSTCI